MGAAFGLVYVFVIFYIIIKVMKSKGLKGMIAPTKPEQKPAVSAEPVQTQELRTVKKVPAVHANMLTKEAPVNKLMDDREHDWLAGQLREEKAAKRRMSDMFELKAYHAANCDAETLKRFHAANCDAEGVDTAQG